MRFNVRRTALAAALLAAAGSSLAYAAGMWPTLPIVGKGSFCAAFIGQGPDTGGATGNAPTVTTCVQTVPAGPTTMTGNELFPADTGLPGGQAPQTVMFKPVSFGAGAYQYAAPLTGASLTVLATENQLIIEPAGTIATLTVLLPAAALLVDGQRWGICSTQVVTALTITPGAGSTVSNTVTAAIVPVTTGATVACPEWRYRLANTNWYRVH